MKIESTSLALLRMVAFNLGVPFEVARSAYVDAVPGSPTSEGWKRIVRHGVMVAELEAGRWKAKVFKTPRSGYKPPVSSAEVREEYEFEKLELAGRLMDSGYSQTDADRLVAADLPCAEVWDLLRTWPQGVGSIRVSSGLCIAGLCSRCESVGHEVVRCPFPESLEVRQLAERRRSRRRKAVAA